MTSEQESLVSMGVRREWVWYVEAGEAALGEVLLNRRGVRGSK